MICMSASASSKIIEDLSDCYDIQVKIWGDDIKEHIEVRSCFALQCMYSYMSIVLNFRSKWNCH